MCTTAEGKRSTVHVCGVCTIKHITISQDHWAPWNCEHHDVIFGLHLQQNELTPDFAFSFLPGQSTNLKTRSWDWRVCLMAWAPSMATRIEGCPIQTTRIEARNVATLQQRNRQVAILHLDTHCLYYIQKLNVFYCFLFWILKACEHEVMPMQYDVCQPSHTMSRLTLNTLLKLIFCLFCEVASSMIHIVIELQCAKKIIASVGPVLNDVSEREKNDLASFLLLFALLIFHAHAAMLLGSARASPPF